MSLATTCAPPRWKRPTQAWYSSSKRRLPQGVLLVCKPFSNTLFLQAIHMAAASNHRLQVLRQENARMQEKLQQVRLVSRAKCCLIAERGMSEAEAHRYIEKNAMDTRRDRAEIAQEILDSYDPSGV